MGASAFVPLGVFVIVVGSVGWRLLSLWYRTRQAPELLLGAGLVSMSCLAIPLTAIGRMPATADQLIGKLGFAAGTLAVAAGAWLLLAFTRRVFRPGADCW